MSGEHQILVHLVGHHPPAALDRERRERLELVAPERAAGWIVRIAQQEDPRARIGPAAQGIEVDDIAARGQRERVLVEPARSHLTLSPTHVDRLAGLEPAPELLRHEVPA